VHSNDEYLAYLYCKLVEAPSVATESVCFWPNSRTQPAVTMQNIKLQSLEAAVS
jgi:hypothetical protein